MSPRLTAADAAYTILATLGVPRRPTTVDGFLAGDPRTLVAGIAATMMATVDVLQRSVKQGANLIVSHEPAFFDHHNAIIDQLTAENDPVYSQKMDFIEKNHLVIWHLHDALHDMRPDLIDLGTIHQMGWNAPDGLTYPGILSVDPIAAAALAAQMAKKLNASSARFIGIPDMRVTRIGLALGFRGSDTIRHLLQDPDVDAVIIGEAHEWEMGGYLADAVSLGMDKALIVLGHIPSEQYGMAEAATIIRTALPDTPVSFIPCRDPYWAA